nr:hypothetical protein [uncultured Carboxylicivirga sp.]
MIRLIIQLFSIILLVSCNSNDQKAKYKDFANDWERNNLFGKVKSLEQFKTNVINYKTGEIENPIIQFKMEYSNAGYITYQEHFDNDGNLQVCTKNEYSKNGNRIKTISENYAKPSKSIERSKFDSITGKLISTHFLYDDSLEYDTYLKYDVKGNIIESIHFQDDDTTRNYLKYKHNEDSLLLWKKQISINNYDTTEWVNEYFYDENGNLSILIQKAEFFGEIKTKHQYDIKNRLKTTFRYENGKLVSENLFDDKYNNISVKLYQNGSVKRETFFDYDFDKVGNWIEKKVSIKPANDTKKYHSYIETRTIVYYKESPAANTLE